MKHIFLTALLAVCIPASALAATDVYLELGGVDGESTKAEASATMEIKPVRAVVPATPVPTGAGPALLEIDTIKGESPERQMGKPVAPPEDDGEPLTPDFGILLGGGIDQDDDEDSVPSKLEGLDQVRQVLVDNAKASDKAIESVSFNYEKISAKVRDDVRIFGFIPATITATVEIDALANAEVSYPWWAIFASGKDATIGARVVTVLSNALKPK